MNERDKVAIVELIEREADMTIATLTPDGSPKAATVSFVNDGLTLYFGTSSHSRKVHNIDKDNRVSLTINGPYHFWKDISGVSIDGTATVVTDPDEFRNVSLLLYEKFPRVNEFAKTENESVVLIRVDPDTLTYLNYRKSVGHVETYEL